MNRAEWWKKEYLRFQCQAGCTVCCSRPGVVYFTANDIVAAARFLNITPAQFREKYLVSEGGDWYIDVEDKPCFFLGDTGCRIHPAKPQQCKSYPFWRENLMTRKSWKVASDICPGIDVGPMVPLDTIMDFWENDT